jgi:hypothetical protein
MYRRKLVGLASRLPVSLWTCELDGRASHRKDRIDHEVGLGSDCYDGSGVADPGVGDFIFFRSEDRCSNG